MIEFLIAVGRVAWRCEGSFLWKDYLGTSGGKVSQI